VFTAALICGGCLAETEFPMCPDPLVRAVTEADAAGVHEAARSARAESTLFDTRDPAQKDVVLTLEVASLDDVERVDRSPACTDGVGHRATVQLEIYAADGSISVRVPGLVSLPSEGPVDLAVTAATLPADGSMVVPDLDRPQGAVLAGVELEVDTDSNTVTLFRVDMAPSCTSLEQCIAVERFAIASWIQRPLDFDLWFDRIGP
jgi:hypothetical protein